VKPNKLAVIFGGLLACLASSVAFAVVVDVARQKMWTQSEIENQWGVPVLIDIPEIVTDSDQAQLRNRRLALAASFAGAAAAYTSCLYLVYLKQDFVIQKLDPLIQGLIY
jgi:hypothetical protein